MVVTACAMLELAGDHMSVEENLVRCAVTPRRQYPGSTSAAGPGPKGRALMMRVLGRLEIKGGWSHTAKHIPCTQNVLADGISRWTRRDIGHKIRKLTNADDCSARPIGGKGEGTFSLVLESSCIAHGHYEILWNLMTNGPGGA